jgi:MFS family permease
MGALRDPRFRRLLAGSSLSSFGDSALYLTLGIWAKSLTGSNAAAGSVFLALGIPALFAPLTGQLADRMPRRRLLIITNAATGLLVLSLLAVHSRAQLWIIYLVAFGYGLSFGLIGSASAGLRKDLLADDDLGGANAALQTINQGLRIVSPLAGAALFAALGGGAVAVLDAATFAVAIIALASIRLTETPPEARGQASYLRDLTAGFRHLRSVPLLAQITLMCACAFSVIGLNETIIFAVIDQGLHRPPSFFGITSSVQGAGSIAAGLTVAWLLKRLGTARVIGLGLAVFALAAAAYRTHSLVLVLTAAVGDGIALIWLVVALTTAAQRYTPPQLQGRVTAAWTMLILTPQTISIAAGAALISFVDYRSMLLVIMAVIGACALFLLIRPAAEPTAPAAAAPGTTALDEAA